MATASGISDPPSDLRRGGLIIDLEKLRSSGLRQPERLDGMAKLLRSHARSQA
jgi:hypothetical protein